MALMRKNHLPVELHDITNDEENTHMMTHLLEESRWDREPTVPQIWMIQRRKARYIGGLDRFRKWLRRKGRKSQKPRDTGEP